MPSKSYISLLFAGLTLAACAGCSATTTQTDSPYSARFEQALDGATSDFEREALADGAISRAEYEEAVNRYVECMGAQGVDLAPEDQFGYYIFGTGAASASYDSADTQCRPGRIEFIEPLYVDVLTNPEGRSLNEIIADCLLVNGAVDAGFDASDLETALKSGDPTITGSEAFDMCMANPSYLE